MSGAEFEMGFNHSARIDPLGTQSHESLLKYDELRAHHFGGMVLAKTQNSYWSRDLTLAMESATRLGRDRMMAMQESNLLLLELRADRDVFPEGKTEFAPDEYIKKSLVRTEYFENAQWEDGMEGMLEFLTTVGRDWLLALDEQDDTQARSLQKHGISIELGHSNQFGDWERTKPLDRRVQGLIEPAELGVLGLQRSIVYNRDDRRVNYRTRFLPAEVDELFRHTIGLLIRKRPVADLTYITHPEWPKIEIVKRSLFLAVPELMQLGEQRYEVEQSLYQARYDEEENDGVELAMMQRQAAAIEGIIGTDQRNRQLGIIPVSALYFARMRKQSAIEQAMEKFDETETSAALPEAL